MDLRTLIRLLVLARILRRALPRITAPGTSATSRAAHQTRTACACAAPRWQLVRQDGQAHLPPASRWHVRCAQCLGSSGPGTAAENHLPGSTD